MKFAVFIALCLCICLANAGNQPKVSSWGKINGRVIGTENVVVTSSIWQVKTYHLNFSTPFQIWGIQHLDYKSHPVKIIFEKGSFGDRTMSLKIESQRGHGINSTFIFFNQKEERKSKRQMLLGQSSDSVNNAFLIKFIFDFVDSEII